MNYIIYKVYDDRPDVRLYLHRYDFMDANSDGWTSDISDAILFEDESLYYEFKSIKGHYTAFSTDRHFHMLKYDMSDQVDSLINL